MSLLAALGMWACSRPADDVPAGLDRPDLAVAAVRSLLDSYGGGDVAAAARVTPSAGTTSFAGDGRPVALPPPSPGGGRRTGELPFELHDTSVDPVGPLRVVSGTLWGAPASPTGPAPRYRLSAITRVEEGRYKVDVLHLTEQTVATADPGVAGPEGTAPSASMSATEPALPGATGESGP